MHRLYRSKVFTITILLHLYCCRYAAGVGGCPCTGGGNGLRGTACWTSCSGCTAGGGTGFGAGGTIRADATSNFLTLTLLLKWLPPILLFFLLKHFLGFSGNCFSSCVADCCVNCDSSCCKNGCDSMVKIVSLGWLVSLQSL